MLSGAGRTLLAALLLVFGAGAGHAQSLGQDFEDQEWTEQATHLPPFPLPENLVEAQIGGSSPFTYYIDAASLDLGTDGVVRFTIVARSNRGAQNISFEGLRCISRERKIYAVGRSDGVWTKARNPEWDAVEGNLHNPYIAELADHYFCPHGAQVMDKASAIRHLRNGTKAGETIRYN